MRWAFPVALLTLSLAGCHTTPKPPAAQIPLAPPDPWKIVCLTPPEDGLYLSNGLIGLKVGPAGDGRDKDGRPCHVFLADRYDNNSITPRTSPLYLDLEVGGQALIPKGPSKYRQELNMRNGLLTTTWTQTSSSGGKTSVKVEMLLDRFDPSVAALQYSLTSDKDGTLTAIPATDPRSLHSPLAGEIDYSGWRFRLHQDAKTISANKVTEIMLRAGRTTTFFLLCVHRETANIRSDIRRFTDVLDENSRKWEELWKGDIEIDGDVADQQRVRSWLFNLYQTAWVHPLPPMGLSSDIYAGRIFWDQEIWMEPALLPFQPDTVKLLLWWRYDHLKDAEANAKSKGFDGAMFPWESTPDGKEGAPPEFQNEIHVSGDILFAWNRYLLWTPEPVGQFWGTPRYPALAYQIPKFYASRIKNGQINGVVSPDEGDLVDNDLYTNAQAAWCLREGARFQPILGPEWRKIADSIKLPKDPKTGMYLTYDRDMGRAYKQAAALLVLYPLGMKMPKTDQERMFDFYKDKTIESGPAMSDAINSIIAAKLGRPEEAEKYFRKSYEGFVGKNGLQFSEKRKGTRRTYFLTGAGGCLQTVLYGFAGLDILPTNEINMSAGAPKMVAKQLDSGYSLVVNPTLPKGWTKLILRGIHARGKTFTIEISPKGAQIHEGG